MQRRYVSIPATPTLSWVLRRPVLLPTETRPTPAGDAADLADGWHASVCSSSGCPPCMSRAMRALAFALDDGAGADDEPPFGDPTD